MGSWYGAEQAMIDEWIKAQLQAVAPKLDAIHPGLSGRIYLEMAPRGTLWPCIIFQCQVPPADVRGMGIATIMVDATYIVKVVAEVASYATIAPVAKIITDALVSPAGGPVGDGIILGAVKQGQFSLVEPTEGTNYRHLGPILQILGQG